MGWRLSSNAFHCRPKAANARSLGGRGTEGRRETQWLSQGVTLLRFTKPRDKKLPFSLLFY